ncbi:hypothetical protein FRX31_008163 [Thalictrum thalictroides]|uniref:Uncharacterized protein n=1 Tax=Thalictrum thalictroides TaxID=46969 RepID=A0A7J6X083_THATH|nr:hypothetical protein FRX31_008163 [Thalictrum thalictroides]
MIQNDAQNLAQLEIYICGVSAELDAVSLFTSSPDSIASGGSLLIPLPKPDTGSRPEFAQHIRRRISKETKDLKSKNIFQIS